MRTTTNDSSRRTLPQRRRARVVLAAIASAAIAAAACSKPESQPAAEAPGAAAVPGEPSASAPPAEESRPAPPAAAQPAAPPAATPPPAPAPPPKPRVATLKPGQLITIRTTRELSTKTVETGAPFSAVLEEPITSGDWVIAAAGAKVDGRVVEADKGGRVKGKANLSIELTSLTLADGRKIDIVTSPVNHEAAAAKGKNAAKVGIAAGAGAGIGAIAGGGKGAAIGAVAGAGVGALARGESAEIPAEAVIGFELRSPITVQEQKR